MKATLKVVVGGLLLGLALPLWALGLGDVQLQSYLGQSLRASIPLVGAEGVPADSISARIGSPADFRRAGIPATPGLSDLQLKVDEHGQPRILLSSTKPLREPYLNLVVRVSWDGGERNVLRAYTLLFDPPPTTVASSGGPVGHAQGAHDEGRPTALGNALETPAPARTAAPAKTAPPAPARKTASAAGSGVRTFGPVKPAQTLWSIAKTLRPGPSVSMDQVVLALFDTNRRKFDGGSINGLMHGVMLRVPTLEQMQAIPAATAHQRFEALLHRGAQPPTRRTESASTSTSAPAAAGKSTASTSAEPTAASGPTVAEPASGTSAATTPSAPASAGSLTGSQGETANSGPATAATAATTPAMTGSASAPASTSSIAAPAVTASAAVPATGSSAAGTPGAAGSASKPVVSAAPPAASSVPPVAKPRPLTAQGSHPEVAIPWQIGLLGVAVVLLLVWLALRRRQRQQQPIQNLGLVALEQAPTPGEPDGDTSLDAAVATPSSRPTEAADVAVHADESATEEVRTPESVDEPVQETPEEPDRKPPTDTPTPMPAPAPPAGEEDETAQDPLAEADFHLAYGLHDEAISLLQKALQSHPQRRVELQLRLAEAYAGAGRHEDFEHLATSLQHELNPEQTATLERLRDALGSVEAPTASAEPAPDATPQDTIPDDAGTSSTADSGSEDSHSVEFRLDDFDAGARAPAAAGNESDSEAPAFGGVDDENATKLDLARAYTDMAEHAAARSLLEEVLRDGNPPQQNEARELLRRLPG